MAHIRRFPIVRQRPRAACLLARESDQAKRFLARHQKKHGKPKAQGILVARLGRAAYQMLRQKKAIDPKRFWNGQPGARPAECASTPGRPLWGGCRRAG